MIAGTGAPDGEPSLADAPGGGGPRRCAVGGKRRRDHAPAARQPRPPTLPRPAAGAWVGLWAAASPGRPRWRWRQVCWLPVLARRLSMNRYWRVATVVIVSLVGVGYAFAQLPPLIPREVLFGNPARVDAKISPDGQYLAYRAPDER